MKVWTGNPGAKSLTSLELMQAIESLPQVEDDGTGIYCLIHRAFEPGDSPCSGIGAASWKEASELVQRLARHVDACHREFARGSDGLTCAGCGEVVYGSVRPPFVNSRPTP